jgi:thioredoxin 1
MSQSTITRAERRSTGGRPEENGARDKPVLLFFYSPRSGPSRRMDGLVSWLYVRERKRLRLRMVNVDACKDIAERFKVEMVPTLLLVKDRRVVARLEGKVTGQQIDDAMLPHLRA